MFKKIIVGTLVVGLIGILVAGAITRTNAKTGDAQARGQGRGRGSNPTAAYTTDGRGQGGGGYGQGRGNESGNLPGAGQAQVDEWLTLQGTVVSVDQNALVVKTDNGDQVTVENRPWLYAQEQNFSAEVGDRVTLNGFFDGSTFEVAQIQDSSNSKTVLLRDETGRPGWAGRGRCLGSAPMRCNTTAPPT